MENVERIRRDLRQLRRLSHAIDSGIRANNRLERYINALVEREGESRRANDLIKRLESQKQTTKAYTEAATELTLKYVKAINRLSDATDLTIATEAYLNGRTYIAIAQSIGISEDGVKKRMKKIIVKISKLL